MLRSKGRQRYSFAVFTLLMVIALFSVSHAGCGKDDFPTGWTAAPPVITDTPTPVLPGSSSPDRLSYLALGDSYTIGEGVPEQERYAMQVTELLNKKGLPVATPRIIARTGWTTLNLLDAIAAAGPLDSFKVVSLLIGVNDQYQKRDTTGYRDRFARCLDKAIEIAQGDRRHVFVISIPDYSVTPFGGNSEEIARQIDQFNTINREVTTAYGISYTDVTGISREVRSDRTMLCADGLHPSGKQYALWADSLSVNMLKHLK